MRSLFQACVALALFVMMFAAAEPAAKAQVLVRTSGVSVGVGVDPFFGFGFSRFNSFNRFDRFDTFYGRPAFAPSALAAIPVPVSRSFNPRTGILTERFSDGTIRRTFVGRH